MIILCLKTLLVDDFLGQSCGLTDALTIIWDFEPLEIGTLLDIGLLMISSGILY